MDPILTRSLLVYYRIHGYFLISCKPARHIIKESDIPDNINPRNPYNDITSEEFCCIQYPFKESMHPNNVSTILKPETEADSIYSQTPWLSGTTITENPL